MSLDTLTIDAYQLTTLVAHADAGRLEHEVTMAFFFRKLPKHRNYVALLRPPPASSSTPRADALDDGELETLLEHSAPRPGAGARGPQWSQRCARSTASRARSTRCPRARSPFAGPALRTDGTPLRRRRHALGIYTPLLQVRTDLVRAKLIETPWLGCVNHMSMVASKAARVVDAAARQAGDRVRRAAHPSRRGRRRQLGGVGRRLRGDVERGGAPALGHPHSGTMDHFSVQAAERPGETVAETEREAFAQFYRAFPDTSTMLVDTYDTERGHPPRGRGDRRQARRRPPRLQRHARDGARARGSCSTSSARRTPRSIVSDGLDEYRVRRARDVADGFGVGENIICSPDAAAGIGAVAKLVVNGYGKMTMKVARGTGKATLPGELQV